MSNYLVDRAGARKDSVTKIGAAGITSLVNETDGTPHIYAYVPKKLQGLSPVVTVSDGPYTPNFQQEEQGIAHLIVGIWVRRDQDASGAEDLLDSLTRSVLFVFSEHYNAESDQESLLTSAVIDGVDYKIEFHYVSFQWW